MTGPLKSTGGKPADQVKELKELVVGYAKQETVDPLKSLGKFLMWGVSGAVAIGFGVLLLMLGMLRGLQQIDWLNGPTQSEGWHGSWLIYTITIVFGLVVVGLAVLAGKKSTSKRAKVTTP